MVFVLTSQINFDEPLDSQGPFDVILHKLTDQLARTQDGSQEAVRHIEVVQVTKLLFVSFCKNLKRIVF